MGSIDANGATCRGEFRTFCLGLGWIGTIFRPKIRARYNRRMWHERSHANCDTGMPSDGTWRGRFPYSEIISLLEVNRPYNLAESTAQDLTIGELVDLAGGICKLRPLKLGYGTSEGLPELREIIAESCGMEARHVLTLEGAALGLFLLAFEHCRPGDEAVISTPCFPPAKDALIGCGVTIREAPLSFDEGYRLVPERIAAQLSSRTKLVSIASPQNPTGVCASAEVIQDLLKHMRDRSPDALLFVDETYRESSYGDNRTPPSAASLDPRIITAGSVSKAHGAPGLRVGWLTFHDVDLRKRMMVAKMNTVISGSVLNETLAAALLQNAKTVLTPRRKLLQAALLAVEEWVKREHARLEWVRPECGALCCIRLRQDRFDATAIGRFWQLLPEHDVQLAPGTWFGEPSGERIFRLGFGYLPSEKLQPALTAVSNTLDAATS